MNCTKCNIKLKHYDKVKRIVKHYGGYKETIILNRMYCPRCRSVRRILPDYLLPYKHYDKNIADIDLDNHFEDYPSDSTILRWKKESPC